MVMVTKNTVEVIALIRRIIAAYLQLVREGRREPETDQEWAERR